MNDSKGNIITRGSILQSSLFSGGVKLICLSTTEETVRLHSDTRNDADIILSQETLDESHWVVIEYKRLDDEISIPTD